MPPARTFSFETDDEHSLSSHDQQRHQQYEYNAHPYQDSPVRDLVSPPPRYTSPPSDPPSPVSPSPSHEYRPSSRHSYAVSHTSRGRAPPVADLDDTPPPPPPHRASPSRVGLQDEGLIRGSTVTAGMDNFSHQTTGGGLDRVAQGVADQHQRESGLAALQGIQGVPSQAYFPPERDYPRTNSPYLHTPNPLFTERSSYSSNIPLAISAATPGSITPGTSPDPRSSRYSGRSIPLDDYPNTPIPMTYSNYHDSPYQNSSLNFNPAVSEASINPYNIADDGDDGFMPPPKRKSVLPVSKQRTDDGMGPAVGAGAAAGSAGVFGGLFGRRAKNQTPSGDYGAVTASRGAGRGEKSEWLAQQSKGKYKMRWTVGVAIGLVIVIAIVAGIVGGVLGTHNATSDPSSGGSTNNAGTDTAANGDLDINSAEIQALMGNKNLHKVFPAVDYTPWGTQYPLCMTYPPSQNNVTRDMAVLSQLTNAVRLYGTDCNQTEMVQHAIDRLGLTNMKIWLGVWVDTNQTTTNRQLDQMYKILSETKDLSIFKGAIVGNEALYRAGVDKTQSEQQLINILTNVKSKFKSLGYSLPVATSDLGDNWNGQLVDVVDMVMSNIHPFFAGVQAQVAASWTWDFWDTHDVPLTASLPNVQQIISETGWPSSGGTDCGGTNGDCAPGQSGSLASVDNMNIFMNDWVCQALANGTEYFWFEAFDEPWKVVYNTPGKDWEDKWGLMDSARNLKPGLEIPDCNGKVVGSS